MNLKFNFMSLVKFERMTGKSIEEALQHSSLETIAMLVAVATDTDIDGACDLIQTEIENGKTFEDISDLIAEAMQKSGLLGKQSATSTVAKKKKK